MGVLNLLNKLLYTRFVLFVKPFFPRERHSGQAVHCARTGSAGSMLAYAYCIHLQLVETM